MIIVSGSVDNTYVLFGFREASLMDGRKVDKVEVLAIESTTVVPLFDKYAPGIRGYTINDWDELGLDLQQL